MNHKRKGPYQADVTCQSCERLERVFVPIGTTLDRVLVARRYTPAFVGWYCPLCSASIAKAREMAKVKA